MRVSTPKDRPARGLSIVLLYMHSVALLVRGGYWTELWTLTRERMYSDAEFFVLRCDVTACKEIPDADTPVLAQMPVQDVGSGCGNRAGRMTNDGADDRVPVA